ncbi:MAG: GIY-YIG nuclease family protein [Dictyoglomaceae bacterium]|nr:GIY-YIG nuclease family protein [Dictyoglomaceae bacterium]
MFLKKDEEIKIGSLGNVRFIKGFYAYIGSSQRNLEKRILRHLSKNKKLIWHIDYFLNSQNIRILSIFYKHARRIEECETAEILNKFYSHVKNFGSSDCKCISHLFFINNLNNFWKILRDLNFSKFT